MVSPRFRRRPLLRCGAGVTRVWKDVGVAIFRMKCTQNRVSVFTENNECAVSVCGTENATRWEVLTRMTFTVNG